MLTLTEYKLKLNNINNFKVTDYRIEKYLSIYHEIFPELGVEGALNKASEINIKENNRRISVRYLKEHVKKYSLNYYQDTEVWLLAAIYFSEIPILILRNPKLVEDDYPKSFILEPTLYREAILYLYSFMKPDEENEGEKYLPLSGTIIDYPRYIQPKIYSIEYIEKAINHLLLYDLF